MTIPVQQARPFWKSRGAIALVGFGAMAAFFMFSGHRAHFLGALPYVLLLACPLMHLFMHHGHHGARGGTQHAKPHQGNDERPH